MSRSTVNNSARIYVAGHRGLAGSAILRRLSALGYQNLITRSSGELDLRDQAAVESFFATVRPEVVVLAAARVGGIHANNSRPAEFIGDNLLIQTHVIDASRRHGVQKLLFLGSSCIYPRLAPQPMKEEYLLTGPLEPTNEWYAVAKIAGLKMCQAYRRQYGLDAIAAMPTNLYGPGDNFSELDAHVLPALVRRFHHAQTSGLDSVTLWGTGRPRREFLHVDDFAEAICQLLLTYAGEEPVNVGCGSDVSIAELARLIADAAGFRGRILYDSTKPDGTPRKLLDVSRITAMGWRPKINLAEGIAQTYAWYASHLDTVRH
ncbi:MAG TPA: GDP-L-fucose synthase [Steroidobacteraceae bacterium]|jgi:GDP-L-fucose synthase|nr:GDP-L-fucose synthase [Steroidobacteraceae bacterium]